MTFSSARFVLDSFAVIAFLRDEEGADKIEQILREAERGKIKLYMHMINFGEVYYNVLKEDGETLANGIWAKVKNYPVNFLDDLSEGFLLSVTKFKGRYPISYADAFAAATSVEKEALLITGDPDFKFLERDGKIKVLWIRNV
ncbi:MAG: type II toxin-antitoxin system VapC family toxin [Thermodesulfobacteriota bacterium]